MVPILVSILAPLIMLAAAGVFLSLAVCGKVHKLSKTDDEASKDLEKGRIGK